MDDNETYKIGRALFQELAPQAVEKMEEKFAKIAPDLAKYASQFAFGEIYQREGLEKRERQLITLAALATRGDASNQLKIHIGIALKLGITKEEIAECFMQLIPYCGFPTAFNAVSVLEEMAAG